MKKNKERTDAFADYAQRLKACGHPLRLQILLAIERGESACVKELWKCLKQAQPVISQHLAVLKELNIVDCRTVRNKRIYEIVDPFVREIIRPLLKNVHASGAVSQGVDLNPDVTQ